MKGEEVLLADVDAEIARIEGLSPELKAFSKEWDEEYKVRQQMRKAREEAGVNQTVLGMLSGLDPRAISRVETNTDVSPSLKTIVKYLNAIGYRIKLEKISQTSEH